MTFTNLVYSEFDSTWQNLIPDLTTKITSSASWTKISPTSALAATNASAAAGATSLSFAAGVVASAGFFVGQQIRIEGYGSLHEYRQITAVSSTTITVAALTYAHASGVNVYNGNEIFKTTTTEGADIIVDFMDVYSRPIDYQLNMAVWRAHTGAINGGTDRITRYLYQKVQGSGLGTNPVHCVLSISKDHIYLSIEGPRPNEANPDSTTLGSWKNHFFACSVISYFSGDAAPCVFVGGNTNQTPNVGSGWNLALTGHLSRNYVASTAWDPAKLASLTTPNAQNAMDILHTRECVADGQYYLFPYVVISDADGLRGRLKAFWFAGYTNSVDVLDVGRPPAIGARVTMEGQDYIQVVPNKTATNAIGASQFGATNNGNGTMQNQVVVAIPVA